MQVVLIVFARWRQCDLLSNTILRRTSRRHLDRFARFCTVNQCAQRADTQTSARVASVTIGRVKLKLFVHVVQAEDHSLASVNPAPSNWRWPRGCPHHTRQRTIIETPQAWSRLSLQQSSARSSFMAQDRGNSYDHTVGVPPDDDDTDDTATDFNNIAILVHQQSMHQGSAHNAFISAGN